MAEVAVRSASYADRVAIREIESQAFGGRAHVVVPLIDELRRTGAAEVEFVAEIADELVGHVVLSRGWVDAARGPVTVRVLSPLAVRPSVQGRGVGRALIEHAVESTRLAGVPALFLEGDPEYYARFGFLPAAPEGFRPPSHRIPEPAFQVRLLDGGDQDLTGTLVYPDAFWKLGAIGPT